MKPANKTLMLKHKGLKMNVDCLVITSKVLINWKWIKLEV